MSMFMEGTGQVSTRFQGCWFEKREKKRTYVYGHIPSVDAAYPGLARFPIVRAPGH